MFAGPKMFRGGRSNVTLQKASQSRTRRILPSWCVSLILPSYSRLSQKCGRSAIGRWYRGYFGICATFPSADRMARARRNLIGQFLDRARLNRRPALGGMAKLAGCLVSLEAGAHDAP